MSPALRASVLFAVAAACLSPSARASQSTCRTLQRGAADVADTYVSSHRAQQDASYGKKTHLVAGGGPGSHAQTLVDFDVSAVPEKASIDSATLLLHAHGRLDGAVLSAHAVTAAWDESTVSASSFAGAFDARAQSLGAVARDTVSFDVTSLVQGWVDGSEPDFGVLVDRRDARKTRFWSSEHPVAWRRPALEVCYTCPGAEHLWSERFGDGRGQQGLSVATDPDGNVIVVGQAAGTVDFGAGPVTLSSTDNAYVAKLGPAGELQWAHRYDSYGSAATAVTTDAEGNILVAGLFGSPIDLGGGVLTPLGSQAFVVKLDPDGEHVWSRAAAGRAFHYPRALAVDAAGNVVVTGSFDTDMDWSGGREPLAARGGLFDEDVFVAVFGSAGEYRWSAAYGGTRLDRGADVALDSAGNILLTGHFDEPGPLGGPTIDFGGGPLHNAGSSDVFVAKLDIAGDHLWSRGYGDPDSQNGSGIAVDAGDNVVVAGSFFGEVDFGGGPLTSAGDNDVVVLELDASGRHLWSRRFGAPGRQDATAVDVDDAGNIALAGFFTAPFPIACEPLAHRGETDVFLAKLDATGEPIWSERYGEGQTQSVTRVAFDPSGDVVFTGYLDATADFGGGALVGAGNFDAFLAKLAP